LSKRHEIHEKIDWNDLDLKNTNLTAPNAIMLAEGKYIIRLALDSGRITDGLEILAINGTEQECYL
jgi:hypothetical protein